MKTKNTTSNLKKGYCFLLLALPFFAMAQDLFDDNIDDVTQPVPIDNYVLVALSLGIFFAYRFLQNKIKQLNN
jgi:hypothetical protein